MDSPPVTPTPRPNAGAAAAVGRRLPAAVSAIRGNAVEPLARACGYRSCVARAADGPAPTLVVDLRALGVSLPREQVVGELATCRMMAMRRDPRLGAKTIGILAVTGNEIDLFFLQGHGDAVDPLSEVCLNSAVAAVAVARDLWSLLGVGPITVRLGAVSFEVTEMAA